MNYYFKIFLFIIFVQFSCNGNSNIKNSNPTFVLTGSLIGFKDSTLLFLDRDKTVDSTFIINGKFRFSGKVKDSVEKVLLRTKDFKTYIFFWLENSNMTFNNVVGGSLKNAKITGSGIQEEEDQYGLLVKPYNEIADSLNSLAKSQGPNSENKTLKEAYKKNESLIHDITYDYINNHPNSLFSISLLKSYYSTLGKEKTLYLFNKLATTYKNTVDGKEILSFITLNKDIKIGSPFEDFTQYDIEGKLVMLSSLAGIIILVEFWASWCSPCRKENPRLL